MMPGCEFKIKQRKVSFQVYGNTILWGGSIKRWHAARPKKNQHTNQDAHPQEQEGATSLSRHN